MVGVQSRILWYRLQASSYELRASTVAKKTKSSGPRTRSIASSRLAALLCYICHPDGTKRAGGRATWR